MGLALGLVAGVAEAKTHEINMTAVESDVVVSGDGEKYAAWTFNGTMPGPVVRVTEGDTINFTLTNPATNKHPHAMDFHAAEIDFLKNYKAITAGESISYTFIAKKPGIFFYHCGAPPMIQHVSRGMFGAIIVDPPTPLPEASESYVIVQSEWYTQQMAGNLMGPSFEKMLQMRPDEIVFNGIANQYHDQPLPITAGKRARIYFRDAGPNEDSSFHTVGTIFDTVIKEGIVLQKGNAGGWGSQAVDLSPAQGAIIEFSPAENGMYPFVTHAFNYVNHGAIGIFKAGSGN